MKVHKLLKTDEAEPLGKGGCHETDAYDQYSSMNENRKGISKAYLIVKRCFDIVFSLSLGAVALFPLLVFAVLIVVKDAGAPFYVQKRVGQNGKDMWIVKLRSMKKDADHLEGLLTEQLLEEYHREFKLDDDPRLIGWAKPGDGIKCFGSFIRRTSIDELPQVYWNILVRGNMSVVGPRPILIDELQRNYTPEEQKKLLSVKPGLTGYWQAFARNSATYATGERQRMEMYYVENRSAWLDIKILFATVGAVLRKSGAK